MILAVKSFQQNDKDAYSRSFFLKGFMDLIGKVSDCMFCKVTALKVKLPEIENVLLSKMILY